MGSPGRTGGNERTEPHPSIPLCLEGAPPSASMSANPPVLPAPRPLTKGFFMRIHRGWGSRALGQISGLPRGSWELRS